MDLLADDKFDFEVEGYKFETIGAVSVNYASKTLIFNLKENTDMRVAKWLSSLHVVRPNSEIFSSKEPESAVVLTIYNKQHKQVGTVRFSGLYLVSAQTDWKQQQTYGTQSAVNITVQYSSWKHSHWKYKPGEDQ